LKLWLPEQLKDYNLTEEKKLGKKDYKSMKGGGGVTKQASIVIYIVPST
jgi:hypothetical protein